jgi:hypothetical protein
MSNNRNELYGEQNLENRNQEIDFSPEDLSGIRKIRMVRENLNT